MSFWDFVRGPASVRLLLDFGTRQGVSEAALLARSKMAPAQLDDPNIEITALQELRVVENLLRLLRSPPGLGLEVGLCYRFSTFGMWGYGLVCSATLGEALERALRFIQLTYAYSVIEPVNDGATCWLKLRPPTLATGVARFLVERDLATAAALLSELGGAGFKLSSFELQHGRGHAFRPSRTVDRVAGAVPRYDAEDYGLGFAAAWMAHKLPNANPTSAAMCDEMCAKLVERRRLRAGTVTLVRQVLDATASDARPSLVKMAELTSTSERTLRRRLRDEGVSYRSILAATQSNDALELLGDKSLSITAIAERMGYADVSTFSQAFKRWHGVSPAAYRRLGRD
jgi:AraC-like DNA-binding protein